MYLKNHIEEIGSSVEQASHLLFYLQEVEGGVGAYDEEVHQKLV